jgi:hypothetical protein
VWDMDGIYKEYADMVYKYLFSLSLNAYVAEELTQETFYRANFPWIHIMGAVKCLLGSVRLQNIYGIKN